MLRDANTETKFHEKIDWICRPLCAAPLPRFTDRENSGTLSPSKTVVTLIV